MPNYIEREALLKSKDWLALQDIDRARAKAIILGRPSVDMVEVVRCTDCVYWKENNGGYRRPECIWAKNDTPDEYDYCSHGERIEYDER